MQSSGGLALKSKIPKGRIISYKKVFLGLELHAKSVYLCSSYSFITMNCYALLYFYILAVPQSTAFFLA